MLPPSDRPPQDNPQISTPTSNSAVAKPNCESFDTHLKRRSMPLRHQFKKSEPSRTEKLMQNQIDVSSKLVEATESIRDEMKKRNEIEERKLNLLERLVMAVENAPQIKRAKVDV